MLCPWLKQKSLRRVQQVVPRLLRNLYLGKSPESPAASGSQLGRGDIRPYGNVSRFFLAQQGIGLRTQGDMSPVPWGFLLSGSTNLPLPRGR